MNEVRFSHLRAYGRSAMHGHHARTAPEAEPTQAMQLGEGVHALVSGTRKVIGYPGATRRGKDYEAFCALHDGALILSGTDYGKAQAMADAITSSSLAAPYLKGVAEQTIRFRWMGLDCRATPDVRGDGFLTEIKTSASSEPVKFTYHALRMAYHAQMRMQQIACNARPECFIVCVESVEPYPVTVFDIDKRTLEIGEKLLTLWAERLKACEASGQFPPYSQSVFTLCAPEDFELDYAEAA